MQRLHERDVARRGTGHVFDEAGAGVALSLAMNFFPKPFEKPEKFTLRKRFVQIA